jgi:hypothetical protein
MPVFALIGAGPSLDYCDREIADLQSAGAQFLLSDSIAAAFLKRWPASNAAVFTVEMRRHPYLCRINGKITLFAYQRSNPRNYAAYVGMKVRKFKLLGEEGDLPALYSPGTVLGTMLSFAVDSLNAVGGEIHLLGVDLSYIDNQVYCRYIGDHAPPVNRLASREFWQFEMSLKKASGLLLKSGFAIRTSLEFMQARKNMCAFIEQIPEHIKVIEYSPLGLDCKRVEKRIPRQ